MCVFPNKLLQPSQSMSPRYCPFHKTLSRFNALVNWISVRFYETGCIIITKDISTKSFILHFLKTRFSRCRGTMPPFVRAKTCFFGIILSSSQAKIKSKIKNYSYNSLSLLPVTTHRMKGSKYSTDD